MEKKTFSNGGFVLHKCFGRHISAWYDESGILLDSEVFDKIGRSRKPSKQDKQNLVDLGIHIVNYK